MGHDVGSTCALPSDVGDVMVLVLLSANLKNSRKEQDVGKNIKEGKVASEDIAVLDHRPWRCFLLQVNLRAAFYGKHWIVG